MKTISITNCGFCLLADTSYDTDDLEEAGVSEIIGGDEPKNIPERYKDKWLIFYCTHYEKRIAMPMSIVMSTSVMGLQKKDKPSFCKVTKIIVVEGGVDGITKNYVGDEPRRVGVPRQKIIR